MRIVEPMRSDYNYRVRASGVLSRDVNLGTSVNIGYQRNRPIEGAIGALTNRQTDCHVIYSSIAVSRSPLDFPSSIDELHTLSRLAVVRRYGIDLFCVPHSTQLEQCIFMENEVV